MVSMGIDHSNPYIHSITVLCDIGITYVHVYIYMCMYDLCMQARPRPVATLDMLLKLASWQGLLASNTNGCVTSEA